MTANAEKTKQLAEDRANKLQSEIDSLAKQVASSNSTIDELRKVVKGTMGNTPIFDGDDKTTPFRQPPGLTSPLIDNIASQLQTW